MGCFLACFGSAKEKRRKPRKKTPPRDRSHGNYAPLQPSSPLKQPTTETAVTSLLETREKQEEDLSFNGRKKVTFDLNVKTYNDEFSAQEIKNYSSESDEEKEKEDKKLGEVHQSALSEDNSTSSSSGSFPSNHRYGNCVTSEDEAEYEDSDFDDDDDGSDDEDFRGDEEEEEECFDSYSSLPIENERTPAGHWAMNEATTEATPICGSPDRKTTLLANGTARDRSQYIHSVLNPVENLSQWKAVKAKPMPLKNLKKENVDVEQELQIPFSAEPTFKSAKSQKSVNSSPSINVSKSSEKQEISVDASLSNWLVSSETTPSVKASIAPTESSENSQSLRTYSPKNLDDRPILGALTVEELRRSVSSSPRRSPSRSPDEIPIVGTVGSYWNHSDVAIDSSSSQRSASGPKGIPNTTSKYREDKRVNWHNTPFEVRLERALTDSAAEAYPSHPTRVC